MEVRVSANPLEEKKIQRYSLLAQNKSKQLSECLFYQDSQVKAALGTLNHLTYDLYQRIFLCFCNFVFITVRSKQVDVKKYVSVNSPRLWTRLTPASGEKNKWLVVHKTSCSTKQVPSERRKSHMPTEYYSSKW